MQKKDTLWSKCCASGSALPYLWSAASSSVLFATLELSLPDYFRIIVRKFILAMSPII